MKIACVAFIYGCPRSMLDASKLIVYLKRNGWEITKQFKKADLIFLGTCGFNSTSEETSKNYLSITLRKKRKDAKLIVFGCLASIDEYLILKDYNAIPINPKNIDKLDEIIDSRVKYREIEEQNIIDPILEERTRIYSLLDRGLVKVKLSMKFLGKAFFCAFLSNPDFLHERYDKVFNIRIARGCLANCTYCAIKAAAGPLQSKQLDRVLSEFHAGLTEGHSIFRLVAEDVGSYGQDNGSNIVELLYNIFKRQENFFLIWDDFNPYWLIHYFPDLFEIIARNSQRFGYMGFPVQSGSEKILQMMNREYKAADVKNCLLSLKRAFPQIDLSTHMIIAFPGETEEDFNETLAFLRAVRFKHITAYKYCDRPNTLAAQFSGKVPILIKYRRLWKLKKEFNDACSIG